MGKRKRAREEAPDAAPAPATQEAPPDDPAPDQTSEDPAPDPHPDQTLPGDLPPDEEDPPQVELGEATGGPPESGGDPGERFGVYDPVRLRFLGGVYGTRGDARKAAAAMGVRSPEIRPL